MSSKDDEVKDAISLINEKISCHEEKIKYIDKDLSKIEDRCRQVYHEIRSEGHNRYNEIIEKIHDHSLDISKINSKLDHHSYNINKMGEIFDSLIKDLTKEVKSLNEMKYKLIGATALVYIVIQYILSVYLS